MYLYCLEPSKITTPEVKGAIECLYDTFGGSVNTKGYKELNPHIGLIYGDSITPQRAQEILQRLKDKGSASTNVVLGIGSFTYNYTTRDTYGFAVKATYGEVNGEGREIFKDPKTDDGTKKSARGLLRVVDGVLLDQHSKKDYSLGRNDLLPVFSNGVFSNKEITLDEIRNNVVHSKNKQLKGN